MKNILLIAIFVGVLLGSQLSVRAAVDIYARPALYLGGTLVKDNQMNKDAQFATPDKPLEISKSASFYQKDSVFYFKTGYFLLIKTEKNALSTMMFYNSINGASPLQIKPKPEDANVVGYTNGSWIIAIHQSVSLKEGVNELTLKLDTSGVIDEANENNNIYKFKVTLKP